MDLPGLSFSPGLHGQDEIRATLGFPVSFSWADSFFLVAAFGCCKFCHTEFSVGLILQATIGGAAACFEVSLLTDQVFKFSVASKEAGLFICRLFEFECEVSFHLWGNGGPNWRREFDLFLLEEQSSWHSATSKNHSRPSYAAVVRSSSARPPLFGANATPFGFAPFRSPDLSLGTKRANMHPIAPPPRRPIHEHLEFPREPALVRSLPRSGHAGKLAPSHPLPSRSGEFAPQRPHPRPPQSGGTTPVLLCVRCLSSGHHRSKCQQPIKCRACFTLGHVEASCPRPAVKPLFSVGNVKGKMAAIDDLGWFKNCANSSPSMAPTFNSFVEWIAALSPQ